jgi:UDP-hydrolysing UDP-N-acetyl-D-glucosamine 2-epimerase
MRPTNRLRKRKRIAVVTGTRAEYGLLCSSLAAIDAARRLDLHLIVCGMHLLKSFGDTVRDIAADGWPIAARVPMQRGDDGATDQAEGLARGVSGMSRYFAKADIDVALVLGDRIEALAGALAAVTTGRAVAHVHGGDVALGDADDSIRHAITKLAHIHLAATTQSARRIIRLGEHPECVHCVGAPGLDRLHQLVRDHEATAPGHAKTALVIQHAHGRSPAVECRVAEALLQATAAAGLKRVIVYPNTDRGHSGVLRAIAAHVKHARSGDVTVRRSLPRDAFLNALMEADVLVGNSSAGIIEAPLAGTPTVDVGDRQAGRQPGGSSVLHATEDGDSIRAAIARALRRRPKRGGRTVYGDGHAGERIGVILEETEIGPALLRKRIRY